MDTTEVITQSPQAASYDKNLFTYCDNNPVIRKDNEGEFWLQLGAAILGGIVGEVCEVANQVVAGEEINWTSVGIEAAAGATTGVLMSVGAPAAVVTAGRAFINGSASVAHSINQGDDFGMTVVKASASMGIAYVSGMKYNIANKVQDSGVLGKMGKVGSTVEKYVNKAVENPGQVLQTAGTVIADVTQNGLYRGEARLGIKLVFQRQRYVMN